MDMNRKCMERKKQIVIEQEGRKSLIEEMKTLSDKERSVTKDESEI